MVALLLALAAGCYDARPALDSGGLPWNFGGAGLVPAADGGDAAPGSGGGLGAAGEEPLAADAGTDNQGAAAGSGAAPRSPFPALNSDPLAPVPVWPEPNLRVAFIGDQGLGIGAWQVLKLIAREKPALVVHLGDLSYGQADPLGWEANINEVLGRSFPYVVAAGNHDLDDWNGTDGFAEVLRARLARTPGLRCDGELGIKSLCRYRGLELVVSGVGSTGSDHEWYLERMLARPGALVRLCAWHKNQHDMQVGSKRDEVGWAAYQICARHGAPIFTGHEHSYSRTYTLRAPGDRARAHGAVGRPDLLELGPDRTFVVVSGLGGQTSRIRTPDHAGDTWWASIYARDYQMQNGVLDGTEHDIPWGALFIDFHVDGDPLKARGYFMTTDNQVVDRFELHFSPRG